MMLAVQAEMVKIVTKLVIRSFEVINVLIFMVHI